MKTTKEKRRGEIAYAIMKNAFEEKTMLGRGLDLKEAHDMASEIGEKEINIKKMLFTFFKQVLIKKGKVEYAGVIEFQPLDEDTSEDIALRFIEFEFLKKHSSKFDISGIEEDLQDIEKLSLDYKKVSSKEVQIFIKELFMKKLKTMVGQIIEG
jgi:hypothetical protein